MSLSLSNRFVKSNRIDLLIIFLLLLTFPIFFYKLHQSSLVSFDEAWYADIARNIIKFKNPLVLYFNGNSYTDHPPAGFWLMSISMVFLGINEFGARFASALAGLVSLIVLYLLGKELFNKIVGLLSAIALSSATWFLFRARSGNLDIILTMFFLLTLFFAVKSIKEKKFIWPFSINLALLILTKTIVPFIIFPSLLVIFWNSKKIRLKDFLWSGIFFLFITGSWIIIQIILQPGFIQHYLKIGLPGVKAESSYVDNFQLIKEYLHSGIGKWFWPSLAAIFLGLFLLQKRFYILAIFFFVFFIPFIFSSKGHIWHLIPLYPIMILSFFGFMYVILEKIAKLGVKILSLKKFEETIILLLVIIPLVGVCLYISYFQIRRNWYEFIDIPAFVSDEAILSKEAGKYPYEFYIDGDFVPAAVFYSGKNVHQISESVLKPLFAETKQFVLITYQWRLDSTQITQDQYQILKSDRDKILILKK